MENQETLDDARQIVEQLAHRARIAARTLSVLDGPSRSGVLLTIADAIEGNESAIVKANALDMEAGRASGLNSQLLDRLSLTPDRIRGIANGARLVAKLPDPLGQIIRERTLPNGLHLQQLSVPFGVVGMVYEARPNVTVDAAVILLMSGNAALLRGSSSAAHSNVILVEIMRQALTTTRVDPEVLQLIPSDNRATTKALLTARGLVDLVIPRGSAQLIRMVVDEATVPTIETGAGVCHVYVDEFADLEMALPIIINSKTHRPSVCNAAETLLIHEKVADQFLPRILQELSDAQVILNGDSEVVALGKRIGIEVHLADESKWSTEYGTLEMNVGIVPDLISAIDHIDRYGTKHTEAIVTNSQENAARFVALSDCAAVMINASTRFTDGEQMGFGAEIGISNQKLHARGPMGLEQMTTTTWVVRGSGQIRA